MKMFVAVTGFLFFIVMANGCTSLMVRSKPEVGHVTMPTVYPGTRTNFIVAGELIRDVVNVNGEAWGFAMVLGPLFAPLLVADTALSTALDTILFPFDLYYSAENRRKRKQEMNTPIKPRSGEQNKSSDQPNPDGETK